MTTPPSDALTCAVCGEAAESAIWLSECFRCVRPFHLNPYNNQPGKDCGDAVLGGDAGVETYCNDCTEAELRAAEAAVGRDRARAESMVRSLHGDQLPLPPPGVGMPPAPGTRRTFRRIEDD